MWIVEEFGWNMNFLKKKGQVLSYLGVCQNFTISKPK
jgi:hypothetical protein